MEFRWEALTVRGPDGRVELRLVRTVGGVEVAMVPYDEADGSQYVVEVRRERDRVTETSTDRRNPQRSGDGWWTVRTVGITDDYSTGLAMTVEAVLEEECGPAVGGQ